MSAGESSGPRHEQLGRARANIERELACIDGVLEVAWSGPLIERVRVRERPLAAKRDASAMLERVLGSPACARLDELQLENVEPITLAHLLRLAREPECDAQAVLSELTGLVIETWCRVDIDLLLEALPKLQRLTCRTSKLMGRPHRPHLGLRELTLEVSADLDHRGQARLFSACQVDSLPNLQHLTLELQNRWRGRPLPFDRLKLAAGGHLTIRGALRIDDVDGLMRWAAATRLATLEFAQAQDFRVERQLLARRLPLRLLGPHFYPEGN
jgi:hypothetical protein